MAHLLVDRGQPASPGRCRRSLRRECRRYRPIGRKPYYPGCRGDLRL